MSLNFKSLLALSVAAHASVMFAWVAPPDAGAPGRVLQLDIADRAGETASPAAIETGSVQRQTRAVAEQPVAPVEHVSPARKTNSRQVAAAVPRSADITYQTDAQTAETVDVQGGENPAAGSALPNHDESERHLRNSVLQLVTQRLSYPAIARHKGWQGVVTLELHIESNGLISDLQVSETSGYSALDQAAIKSLQLASIPGAGQWLHGRSVDMLIPVEYRLLDS